SPNDGLTPARYSVGKVWVRGRKHVRGGPHALLAYDVKLEESAAAYCRAIVEWPDMAEWVAAAKIEPEDIEGLDAEFCRASARRGGRPWTTGGAFPHRRTILTTSRSMNRRCGRSTSIAAIPWRSSTRRSRTIPTSSWGMC